MRHPLLTTVGIYLFTAGMIITWMALLSWSMIPPFHFKVRVNILNLLLQVVFSFSWYYIRLPACQLSKDINKHLFCSPDKYNFSLKTSAFQIHTFQEKENTIPKEGILLEWVLMHLPQLQRTQELCQRKSPLWQWPVEPEVLFCRDGEVTFYKTVFRKVFYNLLQTLSAIVLHVL